MPPTGSCAQQLSEKHAEEMVIHSKSSSPSHEPLEVGSIVEVVSKSGMTVYGVVQWLGVPKGKTNEWAGVELVSDLRFI